MTRIESYTVRVDDRYS